MLQVLAHAIAVCITLALLFDIHLFLVQLNGCHQNTEHGIFSHLDGEILRAACIRS